MNDAVYKFKRYEDASLNYTGIDKHDGERKGGWDTTISDGEYRKLFNLQQKSMRTTKKHMHAVSNEKGQSAHQKIGRITYNRQEESMKVAEDVLNENYAGNNKSEIKSEIRYEMSSDYVISRIKKGMKVRHRAFGEGIVQNISSGIIEIRFKEQIKKFKFPGAFLQGFLIMELRNKA